MKLVGTTPFYYKVLVLEYKVHLHVGIKIVNHCILKLFITLFGLFSIILGNFTLNILGRDAISSHQSYIEHNQDHGQSLFFIIHLFLQTQPSPKLLQVIFVPRFGMNAIMYPYHNLLLPHKVVVEYKLILLPSLLIYGSQRALSAMNLVELLKMDWYVLMVGQFHLTTLKDRVH